MEAILYQSGTACRIYLLADGSNCASENFLATAANLQPDEFAKLTKLLDHSCEHGLPKNKQKVNTLGDGLFEFKTIGGLRLIGFWDANRIILCTNGFLKKTPNHPTQRTRHRPQVEKSLRNRQKSQQTEIHRVIVNVAAASSH